MRGLIRVFGLVTAMSPVLIGCDQMEPGEETTTAEGAVVQSGGLFEPMDSFNTGVWGKGNWSNGGMFNCGWLPDHITFNGGSM